MCTVSFIPCRDSFFITSNRDEKILRKPAIPPQSYPVDGSVLVYPKDADAGGTWIVLNGNGNAAVLLNGAFEKHDTQHPYIRSRGLVFIDIISSAMPVMCFEEMSLYRIEPFTAIIFAENDLYQCCWDGAEKHIRQLSKYRSYIWSSVTLYNKGTIKKREQWFEKWLNSNPLPLLEDILRFHRFAGDGDAGNDLCMNRNNAMLTVSLTAIELKPGMGTMLYHDLKTNTRHTQKLMFQHRMAL